MGLVSSKASAGQSTSQNFLRAVVLALVSGLSFAALALPLAIRPSSYPLRVNDVSPQDIVAPYALTYVSQVQTDQAQIEAEKSVQPVYDPADPAIARRQIELLRVSLNYLTTVRSDTYATMEEKLLDLAAVENIRIGEELGRRILTTSDARWQDVQQEALSVLEEIMRSTIRDDQLADARRSIPTLISYSLPIDQAVIVSSLATPFITANSLYNEAQTQEAISRAKAAVEPVSRTYIAGEIIVRRGTIITPAAWEVLNQFALVQPPQQYTDLIAAGVLVALVAVFTGLYVSRRHVPPLKSPRNMFMIALIFLIFLFGARLVIPNHLIVPYLFPLAAFGLTMSALFSLEIGLVFSLILSILAAYRLQNSLDLTLFYTLSSLCGVLVLGRGRRFANFFWSGMAIGASGSAVILAYRLADSLTDWVGLATLTGAAFINGLASAGLTLLLQFFFSQVLGLTTALQLLDLMRPDHPLLQFMLRNAPGSYQHSLQVSNLAEQAAEAIRADAILVRVGAIYHDCGKAANPLFFIENQVSTRINPHDELDPLTSVRTILRHVDDGLVLAKKYHLPPGVQNFIREHHGTMIARYQYAKAVEAAGNDQSKVDKAKFRYPGPKPHSKETAILMLADGVEARARAEVPKNEDELRILIKKVFDYCEKEDQLEDTNLTFRDLTIVRESFIKTLLNTYHPRIQYPELKPAPSGVENKPDIQPSIVESNPTIPSPVKPKQHDQPAN